MRTITGFLFSILLATTAAAQEAPQDYWRDAMAELSFLSGDYTVVGEAMTQEGWAAGAATVASGMVDLDGASVVERARFETPIFASDLVTTYSYDGFRNVYRVSVVDNQYGLMDIYEGGFEDGVFTATNLRANTFFPFGDGGEMHFRMRVEPNDTGHVSSFDYSVDGGESWQPIYRVTYTKT